LKAEVQMRQTHLAYRSVLDRLARFRTGILQDAEAVLEARRFSYQRGQSTLLELLEAQRAAAEIRAGYTQALGPTRPRPSSSWSVPPACPTSSFDRS